MIIREAVDISVNSADQLYDLFHSILEENQEVDTEKEHFWTVGLDNKLSVKFVDLVAMGGFSSTSIHPCEAFRIATIRASTSVIFVHNHTSGATSPSVDDLRFTDQLIQAGDVLGIKVRDHIIIGNGYWSIMNQCGKKDLAARSESAEKQAASLNPAPIGVRHAGRPAMKDVFINKTILYREIDGLLKEVLKCVGWVRKWSGDISRSRWADAGVRKNAAYIDGDCKEAEEALDKINAILIQQKRSPRSPKINRELNCLERLTVIKGGNYESNTAVMYAGISDKFKEFFKEDPAQS